MKLTNTQLADFERMGFVSIDDALNPEDLNIIEARLQEFSSKDYPGHVLEKHGKSYRAFHGCHLYDPFFNNFIRSPAFIEPARQILDGPVYLHQLKINLKAPFNGEQWPWHQDYIYWRNEDQIQKDAIVSVMVFLDDITEFNGPLYLIPGSHKHGVIEAEKPSNLKSGWESDVSAALSYQVNADLVSQYVDAGGIYSAKGKKGTVLWFHGNIVHASPSNLSPFQRRIAIFTYNATHNAPHDADQEKRPAFLNNRDRSELSPLTYELID